MPEGFRRSPGDISDGEGFALGGDRDTSPGGHLSPRLADKSCVTPTSEGALLDSRWRRICGSSPRFIFAPVWSDCARGRPVRGCSRPGKRDTAWGARGGAGTGLYGSPTGERAREPKRNTARESWAGKEPRNAGLWGRSALWGGAALRHVPGSLRRWGGRWRRKMAADSEVSVCPAPPARSLSPDSPSASPCSLRSPPVPLSPRSPSRRCSRSRTSPPPPSGRGRCCPPLTRRRVRGGSPERGPAAAAGAAAPPAGSIWSPSRSLSRLFRLRLRPRPRSGLRGSSRAGSELKVRFNTCLQGIRIYTQKAYVFSK